MFRGYADVPAVERLAAHLLINIVVAAAVVLDDPHLAGIERIRYSCYAAIHFDAPFVVTSLRELRNRNSLNKKIAGDILVRNA